MRSTALACLFLLVCGCGDAGVLTVPAEDTGVNDSALERTREILETCTLDDLDRFLAILDLLSGAAEEGAPSPDLQITGINIVAAAVSWTLDLDLDGAVDMTGTVRFEDALGNPTLPFDLSVLAGGLGDIADLLAAIQDGTTVFVTFTSAPDAQVSGDFQFTMLEGAPSALDGAVTITGAQCVIVLDLVDAGTVPAGGTIPELVAQGTITSTNGNVAGNITFDGTSSVVLDMTIDGSAEIYSFVYDLETGELTQLT